MHPNPIFHSGSETQNLDFSRSRGFGMLSINAARGPLVSHVPFVLSADGALLEAHLVRSNPILRMLDSPVDAVMAVNGGDAYVSPDWYGVDDQVPTWNYVAVHLRGHLRKLPQEELHGILDRTSAHFEARLETKLPWTSDKMDPVIYQRMQRQIVPIAMDIQSVDGTWKLSQNKPATVVANAIEGLRHAGFGQEVNSLVALMNAYNETEQDV